MIKASGKLSVAFLYDDSLDKNDGVAQFVKRTGEWLSGQGHNVIYLVGETKAKKWAGADIFSLSKNLKVSFNGNKLTTPLPAKACRINRVLTKNQFDVLHVQTPYSPFMAQRVINRTPKNVGVVGSFHVLPANVMVVWGTRALRLIYGRSLKRFQAMMGVSPAAAEFAKWALGLPTSVLPNVVDLKKMQVPKPGNQKQNIVFLGRLVKRKGAAQLLEAFKVVHEKLPDARLTIAGDGPERTNLEKFVRRHNLNDSVKLLGFIDEKDKPSILASAAIACFPSTGGESFGIVLIEAMAAGAGVVVGGNNPGYASVLGGSSETLVDPGNSLAFANQLEKILTDQNLAQSLHKQQQEQVKQYDVDVVGNHLLQIYTEAIASHQQKP